MNNINSQKYQIISELFNNKESIYINYLAQNNVTNKPVILTRFSLRQSQTNITEKLPEIIELLKAFDYQGIPRHLDCFESENDFCLVQEYHPSQTLTKSRKWTEEEIKKIAISALEILSYLQEQNPPVFHNQISPENLLIDDDFQVYLINFGFAKIGEIKCPFYPMMNKNKGFIPPEKQRGRSLTKNSDLYSLGVSLLGLIKGTPPQKINTLISQDGSINVQGLVSNQMSLTLIEWLETMVAVNPHHRYPDAKTALNTLQNINVHRLPDVKFIPDSIEVKAHNYGEIITQTVTITNPIPDTVLLGTWKVGSSPYDSHKTWITFDPLQFETNQINCQITIDTSQLKAGKTYQRKLILQANSSQQNHVLPLKVESAKIQIKNLLNGALVALLIIALGGGWLSGTVVNFTPDLINWLVLTLGLGIGSIGGYGASFSKINWLIKAVTTTLSLSISLGLVRLGSDLDLIIGFFVGLIVTSIAGIMIKFDLQKNCSRKVAFTLAILTASFGIILGIDLTLNAGNYLIFMLILGTGLPLIFMLLNPYWQYKQQMNSYRQQERSLINY